MIAAPPGRGARGAFLTLLVSLALLAAGCAAIPAAGRSDAGRGDIDLTRFLPPPPATGSPEQARDLAAVLDLQRSRTEADVREARADQEVSVFRFADVLGAGFSRQRLPLTAELARRACSDASAASRAAKDFYGRPRPFVVSTEVESVLSTVTGGSYPSGHATCGYLWAILLGDMIPERRAALLERGIRYGMNRVVGGVHYPTDAEAGRLSAAVIAAAMLADPAFRQDMAAARAELRPAMGYAG